MSNMRKNRKQKAARVAKQPAPLTATLDTYLPQDAPRRVLISGNRCTEICYGSAKYEAHTRTFYIKNPRKAITALRMQAQEKPHFCFFND